MRPCCFRFVKRYLSPIACIEAAILPLSASCSQSEGRRLSTVSQNATDSGTSSWSVACRRHLQQFLTSTPCTGELSRGHIAQSLRAGDGVVNSLSTCIAAYTEEQHKQILSKVVQARRDQYVQLSSASDVCSTDPVVYAYISMLNQEPVSMPGKASTPRLLNNIRLAAEILHPVSAVCWPWPARTCAASPFPLGTDKEAAAMTLIHVVKGAMARRQVMPTEVVTTDAMLAVALCSHMTDATVASELITQNVCSMVEEFRHSSSRLSASEPSTGDMDAWLTTASSTASASGMLHDKHPRDMPLSISGRASRRDHATASLLQVIDALEALHICPFPSSSSLAAQLLCSAASPLNLATHTSLSVVSPAAVTSAICSLILHFSAKRHELVTSITGQAVSRGADHHAQAQQGRPHAASSEFRTARRLAERYLQRFLAAWCAWISQGRVALPDMCAVAATFSAAQRAQPRTPPRRGPQAIVAQTYAQVCSVMISDVQRRFRDDADPTVFHAWEFAAIVDAAAHAPDPDTAFLEEAAGVIAEHMEWAPQAWRMRDLSAVLVGMTTHGVRAHRLFTAATLVSLQRLREAAARPEEAAAALGHAEGVVWAFAVSRRAYPYSADAVSAAAADMLVRVLQDEPGSVSVAVMAQLLWTFAAMWRTPAGLFQAADGVLAGRGGQLDRETAMSLQWSFGRAGIAVPDTVENLLQQPGSN